MGLRLQLLSDLHLEFGEWSTQRSFINSLDPTDVDVLILAGDICLHKQIIDAMDVICKRYADADIIWVPGNHEYYMSSRQAVFERVRQSLLVNKNLHWLNGEAKEIRGQRFVGATMWFPWQHDNHRLEAFMNDFRVIDAFREWVYDENLSATSLIRGNVNEDDVVITHHLPSVRSIAPMYAMSDLNRFFLCDMEDFIVKRGPKLWVHGHTHTSFDYNIVHDDRRTTRIVCNPRGYIHDLNPDFKKDLVIEV